MGRKLVSQMTFFDFVVGVSMGSVIAGGMIGPESSPLSTATSLLVISVFNITLAYIVLRSFKARKLINSEPVMVITHGNILEKNMKSIRITINELLAKLREKDVFNIADVEFAILEADGQLSVFSKGKDLQSCSSCMNGLSNNEGIMRDIIIDGHIIEENLSFIGLDKKWLYAQLKQQAIDDASKVFYAGLYGNEKLHISRKSQSKKEEHGKYGIE
jgi:uncharacterized membrane protein YcaP (DUF421 family)